MTPPGLDRDMCDVLLGTDGVLARAQALDRLPPAPDSRMDGMTGKHGDPPRRTGRDSVRRDAGRDKRAPAPRCSRCRNVRCTRRNGAGRSRPPGRPSGQPTTAPRRRAVRSPTRRRCRPGSRAGRPSRRSARGSRWSGNTRSDPRRDVVSTRIASNRRPGSSRPTGAPRTSAPPSVASQKAKVVSIAEPGTPRPAAGLARSTPSARSRDTVTASWAWWSRLGDAPPDDVRPEADPDAAVHEMPDRQHGVREVGVAQRAVRDAGAAIPDQRRVSRRSRGSRGPARSPAAAGRRRRAPRCRSCRSARGHARAPSRTPSSASARACRVDAASSPSPRSSSSVQAGVNRGVTIGRTRPRPASMASISSIDRALASMPAAADGSRYHSGVPSGWSIATRPTNARCPASAAVRARADVAATSTVAKYTAVVVPWRSRLSTRSLPHGRANSRSAYRASSGKVYSNSHRSSGRSRPVPSCGHCGAWTWRSTRPGSRTAAGGSVRTCSASDAQQRATGLGVRRLDRRDDAAVVDRDDGILDDLQAIALRASA